MTGYGVQKMKAEKMRVEKKRAERDIYLDAAATTYPRRDVLADALRFPWENPSSVYRPGVAARAEMERKKKEMLRILGASQKRMIFTSGGTEANNAAIYGVLAKHNGNVLMSGIDHASVHDFVHHMAQAVNYFPVDRSGRIMPEALNENDLMNCRLICLTHVNNEIGTICDIESVYRMIQTLPKDRRPVLFVDGVQAPGKIPWAELKKGIRYSDYYSISAHKIHALKGIGAMIFGQPPEPFHIGGSQEEGLRAGTENTFGIASFARALELLYENRAETAGVGEAANTAEKSAEEEAAFSSAAEARAYFLACLERYFHREDYVLNGSDDAEVASPYILSVSFRGVKSEVMIHSLAEKGIFVSSASACSLSKNTLSRVIRRIGTPESYADGTIRISFAPDFFYRDGERRLTAKDLDFTVQSMFEIAREIQKYNKPRSR